MPAHAKISSAPKRGAHSGHPILARSSTGGALLRAGICAATLSRKEWDGFPRSVGLFAMLKSIHLVSAALVFLLGPELSRWLNRDVHLRNVGGQKGMIGGFFLGFAFAFGWTPCIGPILASVLLIAASRDTVVQGVWFLAIYSAGLGIPFLLTAMGIGRFLKFYQRFRRHLHAVEVLSGVLLLAVGALIFFNRLTWLSGKFAFLNNLVFGLEDKLTTASELTLAGLFLAGLVSFLSPCVLPLVPGYISMLSGIGVEQLKQGEAPMGSLLSSSLAFVAGFSLVFISFGASASAVGQFLLQNRSLLTPIAGAMILLFGLHLTGLLARMPRRWSWVVGGVLLALAALMTF